MSEDVARLLHSQFVDREGIVYKTAAYTMSIHDHHIRCTANTASDDWTLTLPPVAEAAGQFYFIHADIANSKTVTVQDNNGDAAYSDLTLDTDDDHVLIYSTGVGWLTVVNGIA